MGNSICVDKESHTETNIRMMLFRDGIHQDGAFTDRLLDEVKGKMQERIKGHLQRENEEPVRMFGGIRKIKDTLYG